MDAAADGIADARRPRPRRPTGRPRSQHQRDLEAAAARAATQAATPATGRSGRRPVGRPGHRAGLQPATIAAEPTTQPIQWRKGAVTLAPSIERDDSAGLTRVKEAELTLHDLAFDRGPAHYASTAHGGANTFHFAADVVGADDPQHPDRPLLEVIRTHPRHGPDRPDRRRRSDDDPADHALGLVHQLPKRPARFSWPARCGT